MITSIGEYHYSTMNKTLKTVLLSVCGTLGVLALLVAVPVLIDDSADKDVPPEASYHNLPAFDHRTALLSGYSKNQLFEISGKVDQVVGGEYVMVSTKANRLFAFSGDKVLVKFNAKPKLVPQDIVLIKGRYRGTKSYETVLGHENEVPFLRADYYARFNDPNELMTHIASRAPPGSQPTAFEVNDAPSVSVAASASAPADVPEVVYEIDQPVTLSGKLVTGAGETPDEEPIAFPALLLPKAITVAGDDDFDKHPAKVAMMQLAMNQETWHDFERFRGKSVSINGTIFRSFTGHHHTKALINVSSITLSVPDSNK